MFIFSKGHCKVTVLLTQEVTNEHIKRYLNNSIEQFQRSWGFGIGKYWSKSVEERLQTNPNEFSKSCAEQSGFHVCRNIGVQFFISLILKQHWGMIRVKY